MGHKAIREDEEIMEEGASVDKIEEKKAVEDKQDFDFTIPPLKGDEYIPRDVPISYCKIFFNLHRLDLNKY